MTHNPVADENLSTPPAAQAPESARLPERAAPDLETAVGGDGAAPHPEAEIEVWAGRTHWKHYAGRLMLWLAGNVIVAVLIAWVAGRVDWLGGRGAFGAIFGLLLLSGLLVVGRVALTVLSRRYRVTSQRLFIDRGILSQTVDQTELIRVDDVRICKSFLDRVFGLGSVRILSTDSTDREVLIEGISAPDAVAEAIRTHMRTLRRKSLFVENL